MLSLYRCLACQHVYRSEISELVKHSDPYVYKKPRWRLTPSGCYVPPPLKDLKFYYPSLFAYAGQLLRHSSEQGTKTNKLTESGPSE